MSKPSSISSVDPHDSEMRGEYSSLVANGGTEDHERRSARHSSEFSRRSCDAAWSNASGLVAENKSVFSKRGLFSAHFTVMRIDARDRRGFRHAFSSIQMIRSKEIAIRED